RVTISVAKAAELYGLCENSFRKLVNRKDFPKVKVGRRIVIIRSQLMSFMEKLAEKS
ncbi:MAG TPA: DNA-binding protein, partial [Desulfosporosinus sp.]|nr:DNA-binding protein [Desulfosporosinus sp.]